MTANGLQLGEGGGVPQNLLRSRKIQIYEKLSNGELNPRLRQTAVMGWFVCPTVPQDSQRQT